MKQAPLPVEQLIQRFRNNECTPEEIELLQEWLTQLELSDESTGLTPEQLDAIKTRMYQQLMQTRPVVINHHRFIYRRLLVAAGWFIVAVSVIILWRLTKPAATGSNKQQPMLTIIENNRAGIRRITLPDGSQVWLNMYSRLEFDPQQFNKTERLVKLSGEGFFEVAPSISPLASGGGKRISFIVQTGSLRTRVLGTAFNIEAYSNESEVRVALVHGSIALDDTSTNQTTLLTPNHSLRYSKQTQSWQIMPVEAAPVAAWTKGWLVFNEVPLAEAIERIRERYQVNIEYNPALVQGKRITASFRNSTWPMVLTNVLFVHDLKYKKIGDKVVITKKA